MVAKWVLCICMFNDCKRYSLTVKSGNRARVLAIVTTHGTNFYFMCVA